MAYVTRHNRYSLKAELDQTKRKLLESCSRLEELLRRREEELRYWEEELRRYREEEARQEAERRRLEEQQQRSFEEQRRRSQEESATRRSAVANAWVQYEERWQNLQAMTSGLTFCSIPWPVVIAVTLPESLASDSISQFILSPDHSQTKSRKRRIHAALLRWHTDHFDRRVLHKVVDRDRPAVKEGVGRVVRCLNQMLASERA